MSFINFNFWFVNEIDFNSQLADSVTGFNSSTFVRVFTSPNEQFLLTNKTSFDRAKASFDANKPCVVIIHGWQDLYSKDVWINVSAHFLFD